MLFDFNDFVIVFCSGKFEYKKSRFAFCVVFGTELILSDGSTELILSDG